MNETNRRERGYEKKITGKHPPFAPEASLTGVGRLDLSGGPRDERIGGEGLWRRLRRTVSLAHHNGIVRIRARRQRVQPARFDLLDVVERRQPGIKGLRTKQDRIATG